MSEAIKILKQTQLPRSRVILSVIDYLLENGGAWNGSQIKLAETLLCSRNWLGEMLKELAEAGVVEFGEKKSFNSPKEIRLKHIIKREVA